MTCDRCGKELQIGEWPLCGGKHAHGFTTVQIIRDEIPGGKVFENGFPTPQRFESHSEHRKALDARGLRCGAGKPKVPRLMDATTLENARILLERAGQAASSGPDPSLTMAFEWRDVTL